MDRPDEVGELEADAQVDHPYNYFTSARRSYGSLWDQINGAGGWETNPWVWVLAFQRVEMS
ncbi:hypothetical protein [Aquincola tertiaricarbonis]|uniref:hypothetical protein n=1 Tax=Aquincola tertiaricarbonis TaxID=391953 RepID=UPI0018DD4F5F|nr:hypothetical protein [Aquincola tertiaricarbonis]